MSVSQIKLHSQGASGTATGTDDGNATRSYRSMYRVQVSDPLDTASTVLVYFSLNADYPWPGRIFYFGNGFDTGVICKTVDAQYEEKSNGWFTVACTFGPAKGEEQKQSGAMPDGNTSQDPTQWHDEIDISYTQIAVPVETAKFRGFQPDGISNDYLKPGKEGPVVNSAIKPYDPALEDELDIKVLRITKYLKSYDGAKFGKFQGAVNSDAVTIVKSAYKFKESFDKYQGRMKSVGAQFAITNGIPHYRQTMELHIHPLETGWRRVIVDRGMDARRAEGDADGHGGTISASDVTTAGQIQHEPLKDKAGYPITEPVLLDGNGQPLAPNKPPVYLIYSTRKEMAFSGIKW